MKAYSELALTAILAVLLVSKARGDAIVGTNIGGWMVLEPWITPSLFYRFLGKNHSEGVGMDSYTFCEALGPKVGNSVMRSHWNNWVTEDHFKQLVERKIEVVRLPIGDWTLKPYGPYVGCMDGSTEKIQWFLTTAEKYGIKVWIDIHAVIDSQNGFDNSGKSTDLVWESQSNFKHWSILDAKWMGEWNGQEYVSINETNIEFARNTVYGIMEKWGDHPALYAIEPVNEPWWNSDLATLKGFYQACRSDVKAINPDVIFVFHDAFQPDAAVWNDLFDDSDMQNVVLDTHQYLAWSEPLSDIENYCDAYGATFGSDSMKNIKYPIWVGEWSLATDVCALWLGGLNDGNSDPQFTCQTVDCPQSYMPAPLGTDFDRSAPILGPYGENDYSTIKNGQCLLDSDYFDDTAVKTLGDCLSYILNDSVEGQFLWNFRNELEPRWSYLVAYDEGWLNNYNDKYKYTYPTGDGTKKGRNLPMKGYRPGEG